MKRIAVILLTFTLLCACVPTPEEDAVKQKNTNILIDSVLSEQESDAQNDVTLPALKTQFPDRFAADFTTSAQHAHVTVDAPIRVLTDGASFPLIRVEKTEPSDAACAALYRRLLGADTLYIWTYRLTRERVAKEIENLMQEPTDEQKKSWMRDTGSTEEDWEAMLERRREELARYQELYRTMDDDEVAPLAVWDGMRPEEGKLILVSDPDSMASWELSLDHAECFPTGGIRYTAGSDTDREGSNWADSFLYKDNGEYGSMRIAPTDWDRPQGDASITANEAAKTVLSVLDGYGPFAVADVYWSNNAPNGGDDAFVAKKWAYLVLLTPDYSGVHTVFCTDDAFDSEHPENNLNAGWTYSRVVAVVDGSGKLLSFEWHGADRETERISETTTLLPFEQISEIFEQQMNRMLAEEVYIDANLAVDDVQLGLFRVREQNSWDVGLLVPAWVFHGTLTPSEQSAWNGITVYYDHSPLLIVNAIDGSIIDARKGY